MLLRSLLFFFAWISFLLGMIGIFIPLLPTTPFLILSAFLFSKSSEKFHQWILSLPMAGPAIKEWRNHRVVRTKAKILCFVMISMSLYFILINNDIILLVKILVSLLLSSVLVYILTRKSMILMTALTMMTFASGCSSVGYIFEQGLGQFKLQWNSQSNDSLIKDPNIDQKYKDKIVLVEDAKKYFYHYFNKKIQPIYSQTTFLPDEAVTYLVVASEPTKIEAYEFSFPFVGSFPYLGFFKKESAESFSKGLQKEEKLVTWVRPVYAYSTLGYFEDRILSSFFHYDDIELVELVFHELFHTIFFLKGDVEINENLATYFSAELLKEYYKGQDLLIEFEKSRLKMEKSHQEIVRLIHILRNEFDKLGPYMTSKSADELTSRFVQEVFHPQMTLFCQELKLEMDHCYQSQETWNQASFAAFLTYEEEQLEIASWRKGVEGELKHFYFWLDQQKNIFEKSNEDSFVSFIQKEMERL